MRVDINLGSSTLPHHLQHSGQMISFANAFVLTVTQQNSCELPAATSSNRFTASNSTALLTPATNAMHTFFKNLACFVSDRQISVPVGLPPSSCPEAMAACPPTAVESPRSVMMQNSFKDLSLKSYPASSGSSLPSPTSSAASERSAFRDESQLSSPVWPTPVFSPFASITEPLEQDPCDFSGRSLRAILLAVAHQVSTGTPDAEVLRAALAELERLSFRRSYVMAMAHEHDEAIPMMAQLLQAADLKAACKAAVVLWNICFQHKPAVATVKRLPVIEALATLIAHDDKQCRYAASGCLSVLTAASASCRQRCVNSCALPYLVMCLDVEDPNVVYHAGGTLYYCAQHPQFVQPIVAAGAVPAFKNLLTATNNPNNLKLAKRALQRLGVQ